MSWGQKTRLKLKGYYSYQINGQVENWRNRVAMSQEAGYKYYIAMHRLQECVLPHTSERQTVA